MLKYMYKRHTLSDISKECIQYVDDTRNRIGFVLYTMMKNDEEAVEAVKEEEYRSLMTIIPNNNALVDAIIAMVEGIDLDQSRFDSKEIFKTSK